MEKMRQHTQAAVARSRPGVTKQIEVRESSGVTGQAGSEKGPTTTRSTMHATGVSVLLALVSAAVTEHVARGGGA